MFCASDLSTELCGWVTSALLAAIIEWGNYGPVEYWVLGIDVTAAESLTQVNCQRRVDRKQWNMTDCMRKHSPSGEYGFESYRKVGADAVAGGQPRGDAGRNGVREWGIHYFISSLPVGFTDYFDVPGASEQNTIFHEYFHVVQNSHLSSPEKWEMRKAALGPRWFHEGAAMYMSLLIPRELMESHKLDSSLLHWLLSVPMKQHPRGVQQYCGQKAESHSQSAVDIGSIDHPTNGFVLLL